MKIVLFKRSYIIFSIFFLIFAGAPNTLKAGDEPTSSGVTPDIGITRPDDGHATAPNTIKAADKPASSGVTPDIGITRPDQGHTTAPNTLKAGDKPVSSDLTPDIGSTTRPDQVHTTSQGVKGGIFSASGKTLAGATISVRPLDPTTPPVQDFAVVTGPDGQYSRLLEPGLYEITATMQKYAPLSKKVKVSKAKFTIANFKLKKK